MPDKKVYLLVFIRIHLDKQNPTHFVATFNLWPLEIAEPEIQMPQRFHITRSFREYAIVLRLNM